MWQAIIGSIASKFLSRGLSAAFGEGSQQQKPQRIPVNFQTARTWTPEGAGKVTEDDFGGIEYETTSYDTHLLAWEKRLFGGEDSYTKITLPRLER